MSILAIFLPYPIVKDDKTSCVRIQVALKIAEGVVNESAYTIEIAHLIPEEPSQVIDGLDEIIRNELLRTHNVTFCVVSAPELPDHIVETSETSYFRFHGRIGWYKYNYSEEELKDWAEAIKKTRAKECYAYFNNDYQAHAIWNCKKLSELLK
jgi:hypothetical protein